MERLEFCYWQGEMVPPADHSHDDCREVEKLTLEINQLSRDIFSQMLPGSVRRMEWEIEELKARRRGHAAWRQFRASVGRSA